jgi:hypothetical protein
MVSFRFISVKKPPVASEHAAGWAPVPVWMFAEEKNLLILPGFDLQLSGCPACSLFTILTELSGSTFKELVGITKARPVYGDY